MGTLKLSKPQVENTTCFLSGICKDRDKLKWSDVSSQPLMKIWEAFMHKDVTCLSEITEGATTFMRRMNYLWLAYHVFLVISLDWIFLSQSAPVAIGVDGIAAT